MKKLVVFLLVAIILTLSGCSKEENKLYRLKGEYETSKDLQVIAHREYSLEDTELNYYITYLGDEEGAVADDHNCFELHKLVDGKWKRVGTKVNQEWNDMALVMEPHQVDERKIELDDYFYLPLEAGEYRIAVGTYLSNVFTIS